MKKTLGLLACLLSSTSWANWQLDNEHSHVSFVSVKKSQVVESHSFNKLSGSIEQGKVRFNVALASVNTGIAIRDERMAQYLFATSSFPQASFTTQLPDSLISSMKAGDMRYFDLSGQLALHGHEQTVNVTALITKISDDKMMVSSTKPFIVKASDYDLVKGIAELAKMAGLPSITETVPVSFTLTFSQ